MSDISLLLKNNRSFFVFDEKTQHLLETFWISYTQATKGRLTEEAQCALFKTLLEEIQKVMNTPPVFSLFHEAVRSPFDYYRFGTDLIRPLIDFENSSILGSVHLDTIRETLKKGENVILLANHQTEPDPQIISVMLEAIDPQLSSEMIFVAGHRVTTDPLAIPLSLGRHLLCIHSKKHMHHLEAQEKREKTLHNQRTMKKMEELLNAGGQCIYVAPSGGRDRAEKETGHVYPEPLDPDSIELFWLISEKTKIPTHFHSLALKTHDLMPPPQEVEIELGEKRLVHYSPVFLAFGEEIFKEKNVKYLDKKTERKEHALRIWQQIVRDYQQFPSKGIV